MQLDTSVEFREQICTGGPDVGSINTPLSCKALRLGKLSGNAGGKQVRSH